MLRLKSNRTRTVYAKLNNMKEYFVTTFYWTQIIQTLHEFSNVWSQIPRFIRNRTLSIAFQPILVR